MKKFQTIIMFLITVGLTQKLYTDTLYERAKEGKFNSVRHLIDDKKQDVNSLTKGQTPLFAAVKNYKKTESSKGSHEGKEIDLVDYNKTIITLLNRGASMAQQDNTGRTVLHYAVGFDEPELLELLLNNINSSSDRAFNITDYDGRTPLHIAAQNANYEMVELLCKAGAKPDILTTTYAKKPIDMVGESNKNASPITKTSIRKLLQDAENNPVKPKPVKRSIIIPTFSPKQNKSYNESPACSPANVTAQSSDTKRQNLQLIDAAGDGDLKAVEDLVAQGALVSAQEDKQLSPLLSALRFYDAQKQHGEVIDFLIAKGACISSKDRDQKTALHFAVEKEDQYLVKKIIQAMAKAPNTHELINARDIHGNTALHYAAQVVNTPIANLLLQNNASIIVQNNKKQIPLDAINEKKSHVFDRTEKILAQDIQEMKRLLSSHGASTPTASAKPKTLWPSNQTAADTTNPGDKDKENVMDWENVARTSRARSQSILGRPNGLKKD